MRFARCAYLSCHQYGAPSLLTLSSQIGECVFWPMTEALFGEGLTKETCPHMFKAFEDIDDNFGKALRGKPVKVVEEGVAYAKAVYEKMIRADNKGPLLEFYSDLMDGIDPVNTAKFATSAWWGGQVSSKHAAVYFLLSPH